MRRPPVLLVIVAVLLAGVSVGWAASSQSPSPALLASPVLAEETPQPSSPKVSAAAESADHSLTLTETGIDAAPAHLAVEHGPSSAEAAPAPSTTVPAPPPAPSVAFSAAQAYGSCDEPIPYDIFSGTADPRSTVTISSPYGSATATADGSGHWERTVEFAGAPRGGTFAVSVSGVGGSKTFDFSVGH